MYIYDKGIQYTDAMSIGRLLKKNKQINTIIFGGRITFFKEDYAKMFTELFEKKLVNEIKQSQFKGATDGVDYLLTMLGIIPKSNKRNSFTAAYGNSNDPNFYHSNVYNNSSVPINSNVSKLYKSV